MMIDSSTLRILNNGQILGTGYLVTKDLVVTCAHVVGTAGAIIEVQFIGRAETQFARAIPKYWRNEGAEDVAILQLEKPVDDIKPLILGSTTGTIGHTFSTFGFPNDGQGLAGRGEIIGQVIINGLRLLQLDSKQVTSGFSGGPIFDEVTKRVVGMVISITPPDQYQRQGTTGFAIPSEALWEICEEIRPRETAPYLGLATFTEETTELFFGREALTEKLLNILRKRCHFLAVFGASGSGKSSVVQAGLLSALKKGKLPGSQKWAQIIIRPADNPFEQMRLAGINISDVNKYFLLHKDVERLVLVIDQFEEIFTLCPDDARTRFVQELAAALNSPKLILILSMRDEFYSSFNAKTSALSESPHLHVENVPGTLKQDELVAMIEQPAEAVGLVLEEGLTERIIEDLTRDGEAVSSCLPLLEFALMQLWERRRDGMLTHEAYQFIDGVTGSLTGWADDAYGNLSTENQPLAEALLTSLIHLGDEAQGLPDTRRRRTLAEFDEPTRSIIKYFADLRLLVTAEEKVELIHDTLLREWKLLANWLNENRNFLTWRQKLAERCKEWKSGRAELLHGRELAIAQDHWAKRSKDLVELSEYILQSERQAQLTRRVITGGIALAFVLLGAFGVFAWGQRNKAISAQSTTIAAAKTQIFAVANEQIALSTAQAGSTQQAIIQATADAIKVTATSQSVLTDEQVLLKLSEELSAEAQSLLSTNYTQSLLLGIESYRLLESKNLSQGRYPDTLPELFQELPHGLMQTIAFPPPETVRKIVYSPNGELLATLSDRISLWDTKIPFAAEPVKSWNNISASSPSDVAFNPASTIMIIGFQDGTVEIWDITTTNVRIINTFSIFQTQSNVKVAVSTDNNILAVAGQGTIKLFDLSNLDSLKEIGHISHPQEGHEINYLWFDPNVEEPYLVSGGEDGTFRVWNLLAASSFSPSESQRSILRNFGVADIAISSKYVVVAGAQTLDIYLSFTSGFIPISSVEYRRFHDGLITSMVINLDNTSLFTAYDDGWIVEWDLTDPRNVRTKNIYRAHTNLVGSMAIHPSGRFIASGGNDSRAIIWDVSKDVLQVLWKSQLRVVDDLLITDVAYNPTLKLLASGIVGDNQSNVVLWDLSNPENIRISREFSMKNPVERVAFSPDDSTLFYLGGFIFSYRPPGYMMNLTQSTPRHIFELNTTDIFVPGNTYLLAGEMGDDTMKIFRWDISKNNITRETRPVSFDACPFKDVAFARNGEFAAIATCNLQLWDFSDGKQPVLITELDSLLPNGVALNADGTLLAVANSDNSFSIWKLLSNGEFSLVATKKIAHLNGIIGLTISPDERLIASGGEDESVILWDITNPENPSQRVILNGHFSSLMNGGIFFSEDGNTLISASKSEVILWDVDPKSWIEKACRLAGRNFTQQEWQQFIGSSIPYHATCLDFSISEN